MKRLLAICFLLLLFTVPSQAALEDKTPLQEGNSPEHQIHPLTLPRTETWQIQEDALLLAKRDKKHSKGKKHDHDDDDEDDDDEDDDHSGKGKKKKKWKKKHQGKGQPDQAKWKPYHNNKLPEWAQDCGLPPGLAKQNKIPPGWEKKCKKGYKYYEHEDEFREDVRHEYGKVDPNSPAYQTVFAMDDAACKTNALEAAGSVGEGIAKGAVYGGVLGAATGAIFEAVNDGSPEHGAIYGAVGGAAGGATLGGIVASKDYDSAYRRCMNKRGHKVD